MPRKYRPPDARRRKGRRTASPHIFLQPAEGSAAAEPDGEAVTTPEVPASEERSSGAQSARVLATKHVSRDYSYVRGEVRQIVLVAGFLIISLVITALLRN